MKKYTDHKKESKKDIDRRKALVKTGKYAAFTAVAMMMVLSPQKALASNGTQGITPARLPNRR